MTESLLPHSAANEESLLGAILINPEVMQEFDLEADEFYIERNRWIWQAIRELRDTGQAIDYVTVCTQLSKAGLLDKVGGSSRMTSLVNDCPSSLHASTYAKSIRENAMRRNTIQIAQDIAIHAFDSDQPLTDFIPNSIDRLSRLAMTGAGATHWGKYLSTLYDQVETASQNPQETYGITTGILDFDTIAGGLIPGEVMKLSGEPGIGKSMLAMQMVCNAAKKRHPGVCYHLEMSGCAVARRVISAMSGVTTHAMRTGNIESDDWTKITGAFEKADILPIYMSDSSTWTTAAMRVDLERLIGLYHIEWVLVDYEALLCDDQGKDDNTRSKVISSRLHGIIKDLGLAGLVIDDMHKEGIKTAGGQGQASLAGSARKLYDADSIWIMRRKKDVPNIIQLISEKLREGENENSRIVELLRVKGIPEFKNITKVERVPDWTQK